MCARSANAWVTFCVSAVCCCGPRPFRSASTWMVLPPSTSTVGWLSPAAWTASRACVWVTPGAWTSHEVPPLKSMPRFSPRTPSDTSPATMMTPEMRNHTRRRPTKSKDVPPW